MAIPYEHVWALGPVCLVALVGLIVLLLDLVLTGEQRDMLLPVAGNGLGLAAIFSYIARNKYVVRHAGVPAGMDVAGGVDLDRFVLALTIIFCLAGFLTLWLAPTYLKRRQMHEGPYAASVVFSVAGMILMAQASDLLIMFIGLEVMSVSFYVLAGLDTQDARSPEAALKYFLNGAFASGIILYGIVLVYGSTGTIDFRLLAPQVQNLAAVSSGSIVTLARAGLGLVLAGFFFKIASVPFHMWAPDVYEGAPAPVSAFLSTGVKAAAFAGMMRILYLGFAHFATTWQAVLWGVAIATMVVGNVGAMAQDSLKRLLAYSSVAHAGYLLVALLSVNPLTGDWSGGQALIFYLIAYTMATVGAFAILSWTGTEGEAHEHLADYRGLAKIHPGMAALLTLFMLGLAGMPPTAGFIGKYFIFAAAVKHGHVDLAVIGVMSSLLSVYYYLKVVVNMYFRDPDPEAPFTYTPNVTTSMALTVCAIGVLWLGVCPSRAWQLATNAMLALF